MFTVALLAWAGALAKEGKDYGNLKDDASTCGVLGLAIRSMTNEQSKPLASILPRGLIAIRGEGARAFLQGVVSNNVESARGDVLIYAFLLTPQGKYLYDFLVLESADGLWIDIAQADTSGLIAKLSQYRLRAKIAIEDICGQIAVAAIWGGIVPSDSGLRRLTDPRATGLGERAYLPRDTARPALETTGATLANTVLYAAHLLSLGVPNGESDFQREQSFLLECNAEELHGVDFRKGCYVGQEMTARMKHRGTARRRIMRVAMAGGIAAPGTPILDGSREIGAVLGGQGEQAMALIRLDRLHDAGPRALTAAGRTISIHRPSYPLIVPEEEINQ
jgi:folate-binding protein YgfZ